MAFRARVKSARARYRTRREQKKSSKLLVQHSAQLSRAPSDLKVRALEAISSGWRARTTFDPNRPVGNPPELLFRVPVLNARVLWWTFVRSAELTLFLSAGFVVRYCGQRVILGTNIEELFRNWAMGVLEGWGVSCVGNGLGSLVLGLRKLFAGFFGRNWPPECIAIRRVRDFSAYVYQKVNYNFIV